MSTNIKHDDSKDIVSTSRVSPIATAEKPHSAVQPVRCQPPTAAEPTHAFDESMLFRPILRLVGEN